MGDSVVGQMGGRQRPERINKYNGQTTWGLKLYTTKPKTKCKHKHERKCKQRPTQNGGVAQKSKSAFNLLFCE